MVYFAGHGTVGTCQAESTGNVNAKDRFYLVPHDLGYKGPFPSECDQRIWDELAKNSISDEDLQLLFEGMDAEHILLVIDACDSGQALESEERRRGPTNSRGLAQLAYEKGMYVLTAAQSLQDAKADKKNAQGHGYLTFALVGEALKGGVADADQDGKIDVREWMNYAVRRVPLMQQANQQTRQPQVPPPGDEVRRLHRRKGTEIQQPRVFYRRDVEAKPLIVSEP